MFGRFLSTPLVLRKYFDGFTFFNNIVALLQMQDYDTFGNRSSLKNNSFTTLKVEMRFGKF